MIVTVVVCFVSFSFGCVIGWVVNSLMRNSNEMMVAELYKKQCDDMTERLTELEMALQEDE